ncbi:hypothetical protein EU527_16945 [Candidatus Thorarchaeota archaeon]|nr:MAG: hypothetical protein EU527_16945 [Candidatus Thorarchaeota archaeon]
MPRDTSRNPAVFEIIEIPRSYIESSMTENPREPQVWNAKRVHDIFGCFLDTFLFSDETAFRIEVARSKIRLLYLLPFQTSSPMFESIHGAHFQDFEMQQTTNTPTPNSEDGIHACVIRGVSRVVERAFGAM